MALTIEQINSTKPTSKDIKLYDTDGMYLIVTSKNKRWWRLKYRFEGKEKLISLGTYPEVSLAAARIARNDARKLLANGTDPSAARQDEKKKKAPTPTTTTVAEAAAAWISHQKQGTPGEGRNWSDGYATQIEQRLQRHIVKYIGTVPVDSVTCDGLLRLLGPLLPDIQHRVRSDLYRVFSYAAIMGWRSRDTHNPADGLQDLLKTRPKRKHFPAITNPNEYGEMLRACDCYTGSTTVRMLLRLAPLLFQRPTELRLAKWGEFDFETALWTIPPERMKSGEEHWVPLSRQAIALLKSLEPLTRTDPNSYLFPGERQRGTDIRPLSNCTATAALANMGYRDRQTAHGFRASARTILDEGLKIDVRFIEQQLDHLTKTPDGKAYDRAKFMPERREMMQTWADYLDKLRKTNKVGGSWPSAIQEPAGQVEGEGFNLRRIRRGPKAASDGTQTRKTQEV